MGQFFKWVEIGKKESSTFRQENQKHKYRAGDLLSWQDSAHEKDHSRGFSRSPNVSEWQKKLMKH